MKNIDFTQLAQEIEQLGDYMRDRVVAMYIVSVGYRGMEVGVDVCWRREELLWVFGRMIMEVESGGIPDLRLKVWTDDPEDYEISGLRIERRDAATLRAIYFNDYRFEEGKEYRFWASKHWP